MKESRKIEFKENITNSFLKTVSAYSNYEGGTIVFGIDDEGNIIGIDGSLEDICLDLENRINDSIKPNPSYEFKIDNKNKTISLIVYPGKNKPFYYKNKAYKRNDTSTIEVDSMELKRLVLESMNINYEDQPSNNQNLSFCVLENKLKEKLKISKFDTDTLKTLKLMSVDGKYNIAAELLSDNNSFPGIDIVKFGETINIFKERITIANCSIIKMYYDALEVFERYYTYEEIDGAFRIKKENIPEEAFREAIVNALVHRVWDVNAHTKVSMWDDYIEISSVGGLPKGMNEEMYLNGNISIARNPIIVNVFYRLNLIEQFGTGISRIEECYSNNVEKPTFKITDNSIYIKLPKININISLTYDEDAIYRNISNRKKSSSEILIDSPFGKTKTISILNRLVEKGLVKTIGEGKSKKYFL